MYFTTFLVQEDGCASWPGTGEKTANVTSGKTTSNNQLRNQYRLGLCLQARFGSSISLFCMSLLPQLSNNRHVRFGSGVVHFRVFQGLGTNLQTCDNLQTQLQISVRKWMDGWSVLSHRSLVQLHFSVSEIWKLFERIHRDQNWTDVGLMGRTRSRTRTKI